MKFGDPATNICTGEDNPWHHAYFVRRKGRNIQLTDKKGKFGDFDKKVIFPGHLPKDECERLWAPIWEAQFGERKK